MMKNKESFYCFSIRFVCLALTILLLTPLLILNTQLALEAADSDDFVFPFWENAGNRERMPSSFVKFYLLQCYSGQAGGQRVWEAVIER
jgi:hypothetical protein